MGSDNESRFRQLYEATWRPLLGYAIRRAASAEEAADVVAETFLVAWRRLDAVPDGDEARLWLYGVARGVLANQRRGTVRRTRLAERLKHHLPTTVSAQWEQASDMRQIVNVGMARLDDDDRELLRLTAWEGLSPTEIAIASGIPPATARTRLHRARNRLRQELDLLGWPSERAGPDGHVEADGQPLVAAPEKRA